MNKSFQKSKRNLVIPGVTRVTGSKVKVQDGQTLGDLALGLCTPVLHYVNSKQPLLASASSTQSYYCVPAMNTAQSQSSGNEQFKRLISRSTDRHHRMSCGGRRSKGTTAQPHSQLLSGVPPLSMTPRHVHTLYVTSSSARFNPCRTRRICVIYIKGLSPYRAVNTPLRL